MMWTPPDPERIRSTFALRPHRINVWQVQRYQQDKFHTMYPHGIVVWLERLNYRLVYRDGEYDRQYDVARYLDEPQDIYAGTGF